jgi:hypothetical protein
MNIHRGGHGLRQSYRQGAVNPGEKRIVPEASRDLVPGHFIALDHDHS